MPRKALLADLHPLARLDHASSQFSRGVIVWPATALLALVMLSCVALSPAAGVPARVLGSADIGGSDTAGAPAGEAFSMAWPLAGGVDPGLLARPFDPPPQPWLAGHRGVDLEAAAGAEVFASADGTVVFAGVLGGRGVVSIEHADGLRTTYEPVDPVVAQGQWLSQGEVIGTLSEAGSHCDRDCLHWGLRAGENHYLDPMSYLGSRVVIRLYPLVDRR